MKIKTEHYEAIKTAFQKLGAVTISGYRDWLLSPHNPRPAKDVEKRLRWDFLYTTPGSQWVSDNLYPYLDDTHIDTALKSIVAEIERSQPAAV
jgi:hypothetical protein